MRSGTKFLCRFFCRNFSKQFLYNWIDNYSYLCYSWNTFKPLDFPARMEGRRCEVRLILGVLLRPAESRICGSNDPGGSKRLACAACAVFPTSFSPGYLMAAFSAGVDVIDLHRVVLINRFRWPGLNGSFFCGPDRPGTKVEEKGLELCSGPFFVCVLLQTIQNFYFV